MEWKKENTDNERLRQMEKEYIEAALRMMKRAGVNNVDIPVKAETVKEEAADDEELHRKEEDVKPVEEIAAIEEKENAVDNGDETATDIGEEEEAIPEGDSDASEADIPEEAPEEHNDEPDEAIDEENDERKETEEAKGDYGVYTADEILKGEGLIDAEKIIEEIKMKNETMRKLTEEQEKASRPTRTCPKCGRIIDGAP